MGMTVLAGVAVMAMNVSVVLVVDVIVVRVILG